VEMWDGNHYTRVGTLSTSATTSFDLPSLSERSSNETRQHTSLTPQLSNRLQPEENAPPDDARTLVDFQNNLSIYGNQKAVFQEVDLLDENGCSKRVYQVGDLLQLKMTIFAKEFIPHAFFCCSMLLADGRPVGQVYCPSEALGLRNF